MATSEPLLKASGWRSIEGLPPAEMLAQQGIRGDLGYAGSLSCRFRLAGLVVGAGALVVQGKTPRHRLDARTRARERSITTR
jgi:hypothetical protein